MQRLVKAIGCPEITASRQLVAELLGNIVAKRMGIQTPEPCLVILETPICTAINASLRSLGFSQTIQPGYAAGCEWLRPPPVPYTIGQLLTPELRKQAVELYVFDMLAQNLDRRPDKVNCGLNSGGLVAFDFELCFQHLFLPIIGGLGGEHWQPSLSIAGRSHLFYRPTRTEPPSTESIEAMLAGITSDWWNGVSSSLPNEWTADANRLGSVVLEIAAHAREFAEDILRSLA